MRCPKCGAFLDPGKDVCFMCGVNIKTYVPDSNSFASQNKDFGSGNQYANPTPPTSMNNNVPSWQQNNKALAKANEKDIFDIYGEHKTVFRIVLLIILALILIFAGYKYYQSKTKPKPLVPLINDLYFEVDENFDNTSASSRDGALFTLSGDKGSDCSIAITTGANNSEDYVEEFFALQKANLDPEIDKEGNVVDPTKIYSPQENSITINGTKWYYLNIFYRKDSESDFNILKYKYLVAINKGYSYNIVLTNNTNSNVCNAGLDNFVKSLEFVE